MKPQMTFPPPLALLSDPCSDERPAMTTNHSALLFPWTPNDAPLEAFPGCSLALVPLHVPHHLAQLFDSRFSGATNKRMTVSIFFSTTSNRRLE
jgi:hypothetical protein